MGLLDGICATSRKEGDRAELSPGGIVPIDRLAKIAPACRISLARVVDTGRIIAAIEDPTVMAKILTHLGLPIRAPPRSPARSFDRFPMA
jgi:hypothetical protein